MNKGTNNDIKLIQYSEKCYVLTGPGTKAIKHNLKKLKLKWNSHLKTKDGTGQRFGGWLVFPDRVDEIKELFNLTVSC
jgi:hypothetical protein